MSGRPDVLAEKPVATDCLFILNVAIGLQTCDPVCICDVDSNRGTPNATDALICLNAAVGVPDLLDCDCTEPCSAPPPCSQIELTLTPGSSDLDVGWTGDGHDAKLVEGASIFVRVVRRCGGDGAVCEMDADCASETCDPTCDCNSGGDTSCEIVGPVSDKRCFPSTDIACEEDSDCPSARTCEKLLGPPLPLAIASTPLCVTTYVEEDLTGAVDTATGTGDISVALRSRPGLGIQPEKPCPRCGALTEIPEVGDTFVCDGGPRDGEACTVGAVSPIFGGTSLDCPPEPMLATGTEFTIRLTHVTTGTRMMDAVIPCGGSLAALHPDNGGAVCLDTFEPCSSNDDCRRCTESPTTVCATNGDCGVRGVCAVAPEQPVACGVYCHCGFCDGDPSSPCSSDAECDPGESCAQGSGASQQLQGNDCTSLICGLEADEACCSSDSQSCANPTEKSGHCLDASYLPCLGNDDCTAQDAGACVLRDRACFEGKIERSGAASPLGSYCVDDPVPGGCTTNSDCGEGNCVVDVAVPTAAALFCVPATQSASINAAVGLAGPAATTLKSIMRVYRCGDRIRSGIEECDDGNRTNGDGCDELCRVEQ